jgi:hypothetical protein
MVKAWFFDCEGQKVVSHFRTRQEAEQFARDRGLELWNWRESKSW